MTITRRTLVSAAAAGALAPRLGMGQAPKLRIGVMNDQSGPYRDDGGPTGVLCVRQAVQEFTAASGMEVEVLVADHQNKPDVGAGIARQWFDQRRRGRGGGRADLVRRAGGEHGRAARRTR